MQKRMQKEMLNPVFVVVSPTVKEANWSTPGVIWLTFMHLIANWGLLLVQPINYSQLRCLHALNILFNHYLLIILLLFNELE